MGERSGLRDGDELGVCAALRVHAEDAVADGELGDGRADCLHLAGELAAKDLPLRSQETGEEAGDEK